MDSGVEPAGGGWRMRRRPAWSYWVVGVKVKVSSAEEKAARGLRARDW